MAEASKEPTEQKPARPVMPPPEAREHAPVAGTATVAVALKLPSGLLLQRFEEKTEMEPTPQGYREMKVQERVGEPFALRGNAMIVDLERQGILPPQGGYAITEGVPKDLWEHWLRFNHRSDLYQNGLIEAFPDAAAALSWARTQALVRSGLEEIDPDRPELTTGIRATTNLSAVQRGERVGA